MWQSWNLNSGRCKPWANALIKQDFKKKHSPDFTCAMLCSEGGIPSPPNVVHFLLEVVRWLPPGGRLAPLWT